jgi:hypothetical protein
LMHIGHKNNIKCPPKDTWDITTTPNIVWILLTRPSTIVVRFFCLCINQTQFHKHGEKL